VPQSNNFLDPGCSGAADQLSATHTPSHGMYKLYTLTQEASLLL